MTSQSSSSCRAPALFPQYMRQPSHTGYSVISPGSRFMAVLRDQKDCHCLSTWFSQLKMIKILLQKESKDKWERTKNLRWKRPYCKEMSFLSSEISLGAGLPFCSVWGFYFLPSFSVAIFHLTALSQHKSLVSYDFSSSDTRFLLLCLAIICVSTDFCPTC